MNPSHTLVTEDDHLHDCRTLRQKSGAHQKRDEEEGYAVDSELTKVIETGEPGGALREGSKEAPR